MSDKVLQHFDVSTFQQNLLTWYNENKRDLPWRKTNDPYKIWISEIMLQQTKVDTVIPYYERFITTFPTIYHLAKADSQIVLKEWEGLGYYSRAENLHNAVREVVATYEGEVPDNPKELGSLRGVGPYTQGAILSIAFNQPEPAVDGNVMRVLSRVLKVEENISRQPVRRMFESYVRALISEEDPSAFNQGLMELGALICTPRAPQCLLCPVQEQCRAYAEGIEEELPIRNKAQKKRTVPYAALLIKNDQDEYVIEQRPKKGLLSNMWQFPMVPIGEIGMDHLTSWVKAEYGLAISLGEKRGEIRHVFSHLIWEVDVYEAEISDSDVNDVRLRIVNKTDLQSYPFPVSHLNMMKYL